MQAVDIRQHAASAPGKMMLIGEYSVVFGGDAIAFAVDARGYGTLQAERPSFVIPEAQFVLRSEKFEGFLHFDASKMRRAEGKLGLGSSAAAAAIASCVICSEGKKPSDVDVVFQRAFEGHKRENPQGSGVDVAAAVYGGLIHAFPKASGLQVKRLSSAFFSRIPRRVVWTRKSAKTSSFLMQVNEFVSRDPNRAETIFERMRFLTSECLSALEKEDIDSFLFSVASYGEWMNKLGNEARCPIVEESLLEIRKAAETVGGVSKPSGAGGGDVALAFFSSEEQAEEFDRLHGFQTLNLQVDLDGVRKEPVPGPSLGIGEL